MQPCSQPLYGLIERSKGMSGDWLRVISRRVASGYSSVATSTPESTPAAGPPGASAVSQPSLSASLWVGRYRLARLLFAPRPLMTILPWLASPPPAGAVG